MKLASNILFTIAFLAMSIGFWQAWAPLGLIVPGALVVGICVYNQLLPEVVELKKPEPKANDNA